MGTHAGQQEEQNAGSSFSFSVAFFRFDLGFRMKIHLIAVGNRMPNWVNEGYQEYAKRLSQECILQLTEITPGKRGKGARPMLAKEDEGAKMLKAIPAGCHVVILDVLGKPWSTEQLAQRCESWQNNGRDIALLVGGPEGLAESCITRADERWSLSPLTFPHPLVRVVIAEQLYRAWSILNNHPYHRA